MSRFGDLIRGKAAEAPAPAPAPVPTPVFDFSFDTLGGFTQDEVDASNREAQLGAFFDDMIFDQQL